MQAISPVPCLAARGSSTVLVPALSCQASMSLRPLQLVVLIVYVISLHRISPGCFHLAIQLDNKPLVVDPVSFPACCCHSLCYDDKNPDSDVYWQGAPSVVDSLILVS